MNQLSRPRLSHPPVKVESGGQIHCTRIARPVIRHKMYVLEWTTPKPSGAAAYYALPIRHPFTCGRLDTNDIFINSPDVSRQHATFHVSRLEDMDFHYDRQSSLPLRADDGSATPGRLGGGVEPETPRNPGDGGGEGLSPIPFYARKSQEVLVMQRQQQQQSSHAAAAAAGSRSPASGSPHAPVSQGGGPTSPSRRDGGGGGGSVLPLALTVTNHSKFGTTVDGHRITGSVRVHHGSVVSLSATTSFRCSYRRVRAAVSKTNYDDTYRAELEAMLRQLGIEVVDSPARDADQQTAVTPPATSLPSAGGPPPIPGNLTIGSFFITEHIDESADCLAALASDYSIVLPAYLFEMLAALADRTAEPLHALPHPALFEPPRSKGLVAAIYVRPEPRTVAFTLFPIPPRTTAEPRSRLGLLSNRHFAIRDRALHEQLAPIIASCGGTVGDWSSMVALCLSENAAPNAQDAADDEGAESGRRVLSYLQEVEDADAAADRTSPGVARHARKHANLGGALRYAVVSRGDDRLLHCEYDPITPFSTAAEVRESQRIAECRTEYGYMVESGWTAISHEAVLQALLTCRFTPTPVVTPSVPERSVPRRANGTRDADAADGADDDDGCADSGDELGNLLQRHESHPVKGARQHSGPRDDDARSSNATPSDLDAADIARREKEYERALSDAIDPLGITEEFAGPAMTLSAKQFDITLHRLRTMLDRTILACKSRVMDVLQSVKRDMYAAPATIHFLESVLERCEAHLRSLETLSIDDEARQRMIPLRQQWDECDGVRTGAASALALLASRGLRPHHGRAPSSPLATRGGHRDPQEVLFRGAPVGDVHNMPALSPRPASRSPKRVQPTASGLLAADASMSPGAGHGFDRLSTRSIVASSKTQEREYTRLVQARGGARNPAASASGLDTAKSPPVKPTAVHSITTATRIARYCPPAPRDARMPVASEADAAAAAPVSETASQQGSERRALGQPKSALYTSLIVPSDLEAIRRQKILFVRRFGDEEGTTRFRMWITSRPMEWTRSMFRTLEDRKLSLSQLVDLNFAGLT